MITNVLVTAAGSIVAQGIIKSLKLANIKENSVRYKIISVDMSSQAASLYRSDVGILVPAVSSSEYLDSIITICKKHDVSAIFVGSDEELLYLASKSEFIKNETGSVVITNPPTVISIGSDKWKTFEFLKKNNLPCAASALPEDKNQFIKEFGFPLVVKPREGHGSLHFYVANNQDEVNWAISSIHKAGWKPMLQEYLKGEDEFTSGVTVNKDGKQVMSSISMRKMIKNGQTYRAFVDDYVIVRRSAEEAALKLGSRGAVNIQAKVIQDKPIIFEINPRFSATCPIRAAVGVNEPDITYRNMILGEDIKVTSYQKVVCVRYLNEIYIPYSTYQKTVDSKSVEKADSFTLDYF